MNVTTEWLCGNISQFGSLIKFSFLLNGIMGYVSAFFEDMRRFSVPYEVVLNCSSNTSKEFIYSYIQCYVIHSSDESSRQITVKYACVESYTNKHIWSCKNLHKLVLFVVCDVGRAHAYAVFYGTKCVRLHMCERLNARQILQISICWIHPTNVRLHLAENSKKVYFRWIHTVLILPACRHFNAANGGE